MRGHFWRVVFLVGVIGLVSICLMGAIGLYYEFNVPVLHAIPGAKGLMPCPEPEIEFTSPPSRPAVLLYFSAHPCYISFDPIDQVRQWYLNAGWKENWEDGGLILDTRASYPLIQKIRFQRIYLAPRGNTTEIYAENVELIEFSLK